MLRMGDDSFSKREGDGGEFFAGRWWDRRSVAAGKDAEVAGLEFEHHGSGDAGVFL